MEIFSALLVLCAGNSPVTGEFPSQRPVTRCFDVFFDLRLNKPSSKQARGWWFETPSRSLWRHCNVTAKNCIIHGGLWLPLVLPEISYQSIQHDILVDDNYFLYMYRAVTSGHFNHLQTEISWTSIEVRACTSNYTLTKVWDVTMHTNFLNIMNKVSRIRVQLSRCNY